MRLGATPVPIPNTMVKAQTADDTALATVWKSRWMPDQICALLRAMHRRAELADKSLLIIRHIQARIYSATARHEHEAKRNANRRASDVQLYIENFIQKNI